MYFKYIYYFARYITSYYKIYNNKLYKNIFSIYLILQDILRDLTKDIYDVYFSKYMV